MRLTVPEIGALEHLAGVHSGRLLISSCVSMIDLLAVALEKRGHITWAVGCREQDRIGSK